MEFAIYGLLAVKILTLAFDFLTRVSLSRTTCRLSDLRTIADCLLRSNAGNRSIFDLCDVLTARYPANCGLMMSRVPLELGRTCTWRFAVQTWAPVCSVVHCSRLPCSSSPCATSRLSLHDASLPPQHRQLMSVIYYLR